jgi:hypothetical protein
MTPGADGSASPAAAPSSELDYPLPNPAPGPGDYLPSRVPTARTALRRSLLVWGLGQVAAGDRRGWLGPPLQLLAAALLVVAAPYASGTAAPVVFLLAVAVLAVWAGIAVHAWHRAARRRRALGSGPGGGAVDLLWLAPLALVVGAAFWGLIGRTAEPALALDDYLADWRAGRAAEAAARFATAPDATDVRETWHRQEALLGNALVRIVAEHPEVTVDPDRPLDAMRWVEEGSDADGTRRFALEVARQVTVRERLFGILPTTTRRLEAVERLGTAEVVAVPAAGSAAPFGSPLVWRLGVVEIAGERLAAP